MSFVLNNTKDNNKVIIRRQRDRKRHRLNDRSYYEKKENKCQCCDSIFDMLLILKVFLNLKDSMILLTVVFYVLEANEK